MMNTTILEPASKCMWYAHTMRGFITLITNLNSTVIYYAFNTVGYPEMGHYLNKTGRPIMYSCEWPIYKQAKGYKVCT